jgi:RimJ/RimL family protein N-acetyltransferase
MTANPDIPIIETERLILRGHKASDFEPFAEFCQTDRSKGVGGPVSRAEAWRGMAMMIGHWQLRGYGMWWLEEKSTGTAIGRVGLWNPEGWPAPELGWVVYGAFEGKGFAYEAAIAARDHAYDVLNWRLLISLIADDNPRSVALAIRLGAKFDGTWTSPAGTCAQIFTHPEPAEPK